MGAIRVFLALSVVVWHIRDTPYKLLNGAVAVLLFFIISGFYMAMVINEKYAAIDGPRWIPRFYAARAWRLFPAYWVALAATFLWYRATGNINVFDFSAPGAPIKHAATAFSNLFILGQDVHQFLVRVLVEHAGPSALQSWLGKHGHGVLADYYMLVGQAWSLSSELWFYAIAPFIVVSRKKTFVCLAIALLLRGFIVIVCGQRSGIWGMFFFPGTVCMFLLGSASYHLHGLLPRGRWHARLGTICLAAFFAWIVGLKSREPIILASKSDWSVDELRFWVLYLSFALAVPFIFECTKRSKIDRRIGDLSYPLYLIHGVILGIFTWWKVPFGQGQIANTLVASIICVIAAFAINRLIEAPADALRLAPGRRSVRPSPTETALPAATGTDTA